MMGIGAFDIETYEEIEGKLTPVLNARKFVLGALKIDRNKKVEFFTDNKDMRRRIVEITEGEIKRGKRMFWYGYNSTYDFYGIFQDLLRNDNTVYLENGKQIVIYSLTPFLAFYGKQEGNKRMEVEAYFCDLMSYYKGGLAEVGLLVEQKKMELPKEIKNTEDLKVYLQNDVEITLKGIIKTKEILQELGFNPKKMITAGNTAITCFLSECDKKKNKWIFMNKYGHTYKGKYLDESRKAYRGGRVEVFRKGIFMNAVKVDCNALYPYIMSVMEFPNLKTEYRVEGWEAFKHIGDIGTIKCRIKSPEKQSIPYLPVNYRGTIYYPRGRVLEGTWTTLEIREALKRGYELEKIDYGIFYFKSQFNPFKEYLKELWDKRKQTKGIKKELIKLLMNSLYGKFGQQREQIKTKIINRKDIDTYQKEGWEFSRTLSEKYIIQKTEGKTLPAYANPILSLWITARARLYMQEIMEKIGDKLIYVAVDGIIYEQPKGLNTDTYLVDIGDEWGKFKIEGKGICEMYGENRYIFNDTIKIGGIPRKDVTAELLRNQEEVKIKKMVGIKTGAIQKTEEDKIGTFTEEKIRITHTIKNDQELPQEIIEE